MGQTRHHAVDPRRGLANQRRTLTDFDVVAFEACDLWMARDKTSLLEQAHVHEEAIAKDVDVFPCHHGSPLDLSHLETSMRSHGGVETR